MYKNYIHVQIDNEVFRINKKYEKFLFFYYIYLKEILAEEEIKLLRKFLTGRNFLKSFWDGKIKKYGKANHWRGI